jgi:hypothetical protein
MKCKRLNENGLNRMIEYIDNCHEKEIHTPFPKEILLDDNLSENLLFDKEINPNQKFRNRYEMALYLFNQLGEDFLKKYNNDVGVWTWLAAVYFEQFCPSEYKIKRREHYVLSLGEYKVKESIVPVAYRHCIRTPYIIVYKFPQLAKAIILGSKDKESLYEMGDSLEQFMSRKFLYKCEPYQDVIKHLYVTADGLAKPGYTSNPPKHKNKKGKWSKAGYGGIRRLVTVLPRLKISYNLRNMSPTQIVEIAGREFQKWEDKQ